MAALRGTSRKAARTYVEAEDKARRRFIRRYFQVDVSDPLLYNLVINVDRVPIDEAARIVGEAVLARNVEDDSTLGRRDSQGEIHATSVVCAPIRSDC